MTLQAKLDLIAAAFDASTGAKVWKRAKGGRRGSVDWAIRFDNGATLFVGNSCSGRSFEWYVDNLVALYNPERVQQTKAWALSVLRERAAIDNDIAAQKGLLPYEVISIELNVSDPKCRMGWYYPVLEVGGHVFKHVDTGTHYDIMHRRLKKDAGGHYYVAGGLREDEADYVFHGVGFSSTSPLYKMSQATVFYKRV